MIEGRGERHGDGAPQGRQFGCAAEKLGSKAAVAPRGLKMAPKGEAEPQSPASKSQGGTSAKRTPRPSLAGAGTARVGAERVEAMLMPASSGWPA